MNLLTQMKENLTLNVHIRSKEQNNTIRQSLHLKLKLGQKDLMHRTFNENHNEKHLL